MKIRNWLADWLGCHQPPRSEGRRLALRRTEFLEPRCLLSVNPVLTSMSSWFETVSAPVGADGTGTLRGATGGAGSVSGDAIVGRWIVQLTNESAETISAPHAAADGLDGFGADFSVVRGLGLPGQILVQATVETRDRAAQALAANPMVSSFEPDTFIVGPQEVGQLAPTDPRFADLAGMDNRGQSGGNADADIDAPEAWNFVDSKLAPAANVTQVGNRSVVVAVVDSGMDLTHPDLVLNTFLNPGEIPTGIRAALIDSDQDGLLTFVDLNAPANSAARLVSDTNGNGLIDGADLRADTDWANGQDNDGNGFVDDLCGWDFSTTVVSGNGTVSSAGDNNPGVGVSGDTLHRHGTHVAGTIGAVGNNGIGVTGVSWAVSLLPLRFLDADNKGATSNAILALNYATMMKSRYQTSFVDPVIADGSVGANVRVSNNSWGSSSSASPSLRDAIAAQAAADILFVAAAGNGHLRGRSSDNDALPFFPASYEADNILAVAAANDLDELAPFSNFGARSVDLAAPGVGILSTVLGGQYDWQNGTSMAAPHVSGVAALIASLSPDADYSEIKAAILQSVDVVPQLANRVLTGGRLNAFNAVTRDTIRPRAALDVANLTDADVGATEQQFTLTYSDNVAVDVLSVDGADVVVRRSGTNDSFSSKLSFLQSGGNAPQRTAIYSIAAPGGTWDASDNGTYFIDLVGDQVRDTNGNFAAARRFGSFRVNISRLGQLEVNSTVDSVDTNPGNGTVADAQGRKTLRAAIMEANAQSGENSIVLSAGTYRLTLAGDRENSGATGDLDVTGQLTITGASDGRTVIDAASLDRIFDVRPGASLTLQDLTITGGKSPTNEQGGGLRLGTAGGSLTLINLTISGNSSTLDGGAVVVPSGATLDVRNSTLSGNQAARGGALFVSGTATLLHTTIAANTATTAGGIFSDTGAGVSAKNSLIATNSAATSPDLAGAFTSSGNNLIGNSAGSTGFVRDIAGNKVGTASEPLNPLIGPLQDNGGPTFTHDLLRGSPALDAGNNSGAPIIDQRGNVRLVDGVGLVDIGSVEQVFATLSGVKFHDLNANGLQDANEPGLSGFRIFLDLNRNGLRETTEPSTVTAADGSYSFTRLRPATYDVLEEPRDGYEQTTPFDVEFASSTLTTGGGPAAVVAADLNGDGKPDLAVANQLSHDLSLFINTGLGTFLAPQTIALGSTDVPSAIAAADFDGDGRVDLVVANQVTNSVRLVKNLGGNVFSVGTPLSVGTRPTSLSAGRLDADADVDLIVTNGDVNSVSVLLNSGSGVFAIGSTLTLASGAAPSASSLADLDGDQDLDLIVANRGTGSLTIFANSGTATFTAGVTINSGGQAPQALATADFNADGFSDVAVANNGAASGSSVAVHLGRGDRTFASAVNFSGGASPVAISAADIDSDGALDLVVLNQSTNAVSILLNTSETTAGTTSGQSGELTLDLASLGAAGVKYRPELFSDQTGSSVSSVGDVNGDGFDDFVIGSPDSDFYARSNAGQTWLVFGGPSLSGDVNLPGSTGAVTRIKGASVSARSGTSVSGAGDFNGDGYEDLIVGAPTANSGNGRTFVFFGRDSFPEQIDTKYGGTVNVQINGAEASDRSGISVSKAGDVNGDGFDDLLIGAYRAGVNQNQKLQAGESYIIFGSAAPESTIQLSTLNTGGVTISGLDPYDASGSSVAGIGDFNGDGFDDVAIGAPLADQPPGANRNTAGETYIIFGAASLPTLVDGTNLDSVGVRVIGVDQDDRSGGSVSSAGDVNGDGFDDFLIGARFAEELGNGRDNSGECYVVFGAASTTSPFDLFSLGSRGIKLIGVDRDDEFGAAVGAAGDLNGDGFDDLVVGAPLADGPNNGRASGGESHVIFGGATLPSTIDLQVGLGSGQLIVYGAASNEQSGSAVSTAGDVNGDGLDDLLIGTPFASNSQATSGATALIFGSNFTSSITHQGTSSAETLTGSSNANVMTGGRGNDTVVGNGGADVIYGGEGSDVLSVLDLSFRRVDGGTGVDTLRLDGAGQTLDLTTLADSKLTGIELIDLRGSGANSLTLNVREVFNLVQSGDRAFNSLNVRRDADDIVNMGTGWSRIADNTIDGVAYEVYSAPNATLRLEQPTFLDYGDAPDTSLGTGLGDYQTLAANGGPAHDATATRTTLFLGTSVDLETSSIPGVAAAGDDRFAGPAVDDEDGLVEPVIDLALTRGTTPKVRIRATNLTGSAATLYGWIDFNRDGVFDNANERAMLTVPAGTNNGLVTLTFNAVPESAATGVTYARFRLSNDAAAANAIGSVVGGEVEDHRASIVARSDGAIHPTNTVKIASGVNGGPALGNGDLFGVAVANLGDLDGDGIGDLAVGASRDDTGGSNRGAVHVQFMNANGTVRSSVKIANSTNGGPVLSDGALFGASLTAISDINGDGTTDIVVGARVEDSSRGAVYVMTLNANGTARSTTKLASGLNGLPTLAIEDRFGTAVTDIGDLDGDGIGDLAVGAGYDDGGGANAGAIYILRLNPDGSVKASTKIGSGLNGGPNLQENDLFGTEIASMGDIDGDGITDLVVGAESDDTGGTDRGALYLLTLLPTGTVKTSLKIADGLNGGPRLSNADRFGTAVASIGDLNGDGVRDLLVGARLDDTGGLNRGAAYFVFLNSTGTVRAVHKIANDKIGGPFLADSDFFGCSAISMGDLNGDGLSDFAIGARTDDTGGTDRGAFYLVFGQTLQSDWGDAPDTTSGTGTGNYQTLLTNGGPSHSITATQATLLLGARVDSEADASPNTRALGDDSTTAPDDEEGVIEPGRDLNVTVGTAPRVRLRATNMTTQPATLFGWIDFNRDGIFDNVTERASVAIPTGTSKGTFTLTFPVIPVTSSGGATTARFRLSSDLAAANATGAAIGGEVEDYTATMTVLSSGRPDLNKTIKIASGTSGGPVLANDDHFGSSVTNLGDLDGDGVDDLAVGADLDDTGGTSRGAVYLLLLNRNGSVKSSTKIASGASGLALVDSDRFGTSVANLGDLNGDGVVDLAIGADGDDTGGANRGAVRIVFLNSNGTVKSSTKIASGIGGGPTLADYDVFGSSAVSLGDLDGDGVSDLAVGAIGDDTGGSFRGAVYILLLNANGTAKSSTKIASGFNGGATLINNDRFGSSLANLGDLNGDGISDLAVGATGDDAGGSLRGAVHVLLLNSSGTVKSSSKVASDNTDGLLLNDNDRFGSSLATIGDIDGDGVTDLCVGAVYDDTGGDSRGAVHVLLMNRTGTVKGAVKIASATNGGPALGNGDQFGFSVTNVGDINGDGATDLAVGASNDVTGGVGRGAVQILFLDRTFVVNSTADKVDLTPGNGVVDTGTAGEVTLRAAIMEANALAGLQEIFVPAGTYSLTIAGRSEDLATTGDLDVAAGGLRIRGAGIGQTIVDGGKLDRLFQVASGASLELEGLTLRNGDVGTGQDGGAIDNQGSVTIQQSELSSNSARSAGAIFVRTAGSLSLEQSILQNNVAAGTSGLGGAIATQVTGPISISITDSKLLNNRAGVGGGAIYNAGDVLISDSVISGNQVIATTNGQARGGAIFTDDNSTLTVYSSTLSQNVVQTSGSSGQALGGAVSTDTGSLVWFYLSTLSGNQAIGADGTSNRLGGAVASRGDLRIKNSTFSGNKADTAGGAIHHQLGQFVLNQSTVAANQSSRFGGGLTVVSGTASLVNSLVATNTATIDAPDLNGSLTSLGGNLIGLLSTATLGKAPEATVADIIGSATAIDPMIGPLADNGGLTQTHALRVTQVGETLIFSPAIDAGDNENIVDAAFLDVDQRGFSRLHDGDNASGARVDIGAFELPLNRRPTFGVSSRSVAENSPIGTLVGGLGVTDPDGNLASVVLSGADSAAFSLNPLTNELRTNALLNFETKPTYSFTVTATDTAGLFSTQSFAVTVTNVNEAPAVIGSGLDDRTRRDGDAADSIDLRSIFGDPDAGTTLTYSVQQSSNAALVSPTIGGNFLTLNYVPYSGNQNRTPATLTIRATDGSGLFAEDTFTVSVTPRRTFEYALVVTRSVTQDATLDILPTSVTSVLPNDEFFVEVWVRDLLVSGQPTFPASLSISDATQGIVSAGVDLNFDPLLSTALLVDASGSFSQAEAAAINSGLGLIDNLHGNSPVPDPNTATKYGRLGAVKFRATDQRGLQTFSLALSGNESPTQREANGAGNGTVHPSQIVLGSNNTVGVDPAGGAGATRLFDLPVSVSLDDAVTATGLALADFDGRNGIDIVSVNTGSNTGNVLLNAPGLGRSVTLAAGDDRTGVNFGNRALAGELRGVVYREIDGQAGQGPNEAGLANWRVYLDANENGMFDLDQDGQPGTNDPEPSRLTDSKGEYAFTDLLSLRTYRVGVVVQTGFVLSTPTTNGGKHVVTLDAGQSRGGLNFAAAVDAGGASGDTDIKGFLYRDADNDRVRDAGEGLAGLTVYLDFDADAVRDHNEPTATSRADAAGTPVDEAGLYEFFNIPPGQYEVRVDLTGVSHLRQISALNNRLTPIRFEAGGGPQAVAIGRFNGDTLPDLAVANEDSSNVSLLLKSGASFVRNPANDIDLGLRRGFGAFALATADFNNDQLDDLVIVNTYSRNVSVLLNTPATPGTFAAAINYQVGLTPRSVVVADVDGLNGPDLVVANEIGNSVSVLKNNGNGTFAAAVNVALGTSPFGLTAVDLTGDGRPEVIVTLQDANQVAVLKNSGSGSFTVDQRLTVGKVPLSVVVADLNRDSKLDIAVSNFESNNVSVMFNTGTGSAISFANAKSIAADPGPGSLVAVDLDGDSDFDLAVTHQLPDGFGATDTITLLRNVGDGTFLSPENAGVQDFGDISTGAARFSIVQADLNGDSVPDLAVADKDSERISVLQNAPIPGALTIAHSSTNDSTTGTDILFASVASSDITLNLTTNQKAVVQSSGGNVQVLINDVVDPSYASVSAANVQSITINGGTGANFIDLRGVTAAAYSRVGGVTVVVNGNGGNDTILGSELADSIIAGDGDDSVDGGNGNDTLDGGLANDALTGGAGHDSIIGGSGTDTLIEMNDRDMTLTTTSLVTAQGGMTIATDVLNGISKVSLAGGAGANLINASAFVPGTNLIVTLTGGGGADVIMGTTGRDFITANSTVGVTISAGSGNDTVTTGSGNDSVLGSAGADSINTGDGFDTIFGGTGNDTIDGGDKSDLVNGQDNDDSLLGGDGNDRLTGDVGNDTLRGGLGDDTLKADTGNDSLYGNEGNDSLLGGEGLDRAFGSLGADVLRGDTGADTLAGEEGNDTLIGGADDDGLFGGDDNDDLRGDSGNDGLNGGNGNDQLSGFLGNDSFEGEFGTDFITETGDTDVVVTGSNLTSLLFGTDTTTNVERIHLNGGVANNTFDARAATIIVRLFGNDGNDTLLGGSKVDSLVGGNGDDVLSGGASNDIMDGGAGTDFIYEVGNVDFTLNATQVISTATGTETLTNIERAAVVGGAGNNRIDASAASIPVILLGGSGHDTLLGGAAADVLIGGSRTNTAAGTDSLVGNGGADTLDSDATDTRVADAFDSVLANVLASIPSWIDFL